MIYLGLTHVFLIGSCLFHLDPYIYFDLSCLFHLDPPYSLLPPPSSSLLPWNMVCCLISHGTINNIIVCLVVRRTNTRRYESTLYESTLCEGTLYELRANEGLSKGLRRLSSLFPLNSYRVPSYRVLSDRVPS